MADIFIAALQIEPGNSMALKNLETARKNKTATHEVEAQIQRAEKEAQAKPDDPQASYNLTRLYTFLRQERARLRMAHQGSQAALSNSATAESSCPFLS